MANTDAAFGFRYVSQLKGGDPTVRNFIKAAADGTLLGKGDLVNHTGAANTVARTAAAGIHLGTNLVFGAASTLTNHDVLIAWEDTLFEGQEDSDAGAIVAADEFMNANAIIANADTTSGISQSEVDSSTSATTSTLDFNLWAIVPRVGNAQGNQAKWHLLLNDRQMSNLTAGLD